MTPYKRHCRHHQRQTKAHKRRFKPQKPHLTPHQCHLSLYPRQSEAAKKLKEHFLDRINRIKRDL